MGPDTMSIVERLSSSRRFENALLLWEIILLWASFIESVVLFLEGPLSEVPL